jgi:TolB-like protein
MAQKFGLVVVAILAGGVSGCGHSHTTTVMVPPRIDLKQHEVIGVIDFTCSAENGEGELAQLVTSRFIDAARRDQGLVRVIRLGTEADALASVGQSRLDAAAFKMLGEKHGVATVITGDFTLSSLRPSVNLLQSLTSVGVRADVQATLAVQMVEAATGASLWSESAGATRPVGGVSISGNKQVALDVRDPEKVYGSLVNDLTWAVTPDFRPTWQRVRN